MKPGIPTLARHLAVAFFMTMGLVPAAGYLLLQFRDAVNLVTRDAEIQARRVTAVITQYPEGWRHSRDQVNDAIEDVRHAETSTVVFDGERELIGFGDTHATFPVSASATIHDFGEAVGSVEVQLFPNPAAVHNLAHSYDFDCVSLSGPRNLYTQENPYRQFFKLTKRG